MLFPPWNSIILDLSQVDDSYSDDLKILCSYGTWRFITVVKLHTQLTRFEVFTVVNIQVKVFWVVTLCCSRIPMFCRVLYLCLQGEVTGAGIKQFVPPTTSGTGYQNHPFPSCTPGLYICLLFPISSHLTLKMEVARYSGWYSRRFWYPATLHSVTTQISISEYIQRYQIPGHIYFLLMCVMICTLTHTQKKR
jgi:hypothetical protein